MFKGKKIYSVCYRIYLNLKYEDHVRAKTYNCLWDSRINKWYFHDDDYEKSCIKTDTVMHKELCPHMIVNGEVNCI
jgi:hypothetical protein